MKFPALVQLQFKVGRLRFLDFLNFPCFECLFPGPSLCLFSLLFLFLLLFLLCCFFLFLKPLSLGCLAPLPLLLFFLLLLLQLALSLLTSG